MISAMSIVILVAVIGVVGLLVVPAVASVFYRIVDQDGYGARPGPRSHHDDSGRYDWAA
jgi:hypothetical protein